MSQLQILSVLHILIILSPSCNTIVYPINTDLYLLTAILIQLMLFVDPAVS